VVQAAHAAGRKVLLCAGGSDTGAAWAPAIADPLLRSALIEALLAMVRSRGYDGIDLDFEPLDPARLSDPSLLDDFGNFIDELQARLTPEGLLLTAAPGPTSIEAGFYAARQTKFDQINLQTYNLSGVSTKETWHNSALTSGGALNWSNGQPLPSCEGKLQALLDAGAAPAKLGLGIDFNGKTWAGASAPQQKLAGVSPPQPISYAEVMDTLYSDSGYRWDMGPQVPWILIAGSSPAFVSYDDDRSVAAKIAYVKSKRLGGAMIWELSAGYRSGQPAAQRDVLLQAIKKAAAGQ
jgi:chitinase